MTSEIDNLNRQFNQIFLMTMATKTNTGIKSDKKNLIKKNTWRMSIRQKRQFLQTKRNPKLAHEKRILLHTSQRSFTLTLAFHCVVKYILNLNRNRFLFQPILYDNVKVQLSSPMSCLTITYFRHV